MGLFSKREVIPPTPEEQAGHWTRRELLRHWATVPDHMKVTALMHATDDQLRVLGWELLNPHERFLAIAEAQQRQQRPDLRRKIEAAIADDDATPDEATEEDLRAWVAPLQQMQGRALTKAVADQKYREVFG